MSVHEDRLSGRDFARLTSFIYAEAGICLGPEKKTMLEGRLKQRLRELHIESYRDYCEYLLGPDGLRDEKTSFIDVVTTNKTDFFREPKHFDYLTQRALPEMMSRSGGQPLLFWSAGCSSGEEPYTLAIVKPENAYGEMFGEERLQELLVKYARTDSSEIIARAMEAVVQWTGEGELQDDMTMVVARRI